MKIAIVSNDYIYENIEKLRADLSASVPDKLEIRLLTCQDNENIFSALTEFAPSILITENLAGFNLGTLSGGLAYNLINAIQLHIISNENKISESDYMQLSKPLSLLMHFCCSANDSKSKLEAINQDIPYIEVTTDELLPYIIKYIKTHVHNQEKGASE